MKIRLNITYKDEDSLFDSDTYIQSEDEHFISELKKFVCFARVLQFMDDNEDKYTQIEECNDYDLVIDTSKDYKAFLDSGELLSINSKLEMREGELDKYGREIE